MIGGPPLYLSRFRVDEEQVRVGLKNLERVVESVPCTILEHHILRDEDWRIKAKGVFDKARQMEHKVVTAAEFLGIENSFLEAYRKRLFVENQPSREFEKWMNKGLEAKKHAKPPI